MDTNLVDDYKSEQPILTNVEDRGERTRKYMKIAAAVFCAILIIIIIAGESGGPKAIINFRLQTDKEWDNDDLGDNASEARKWVTEVNVENDESNTGNWTVGFECTGEEIGEFKAYNVDHDEFIYTYKG
jgi:hypothetical protein